MQDWGNEVMENNMNDKAVNYMVAKRKVYLMNGDAGIKNST